MATINVRRDVTDPFYRYKMERLQSKIEGKGNGIKTVIVNLNNVSQQLARPPSYVIKYFGFELGAQTTLNPSDDRWIINGAHEASKLQDYLDGFIQKFVLCKKCKNPETVVNVKDGRILLDCKACGAHTDVDLRLKLSSFILKNLPKKGKKDKSTKKADRKARKEAEAAKAEEHSVNGNSPNDSNSETGNAEENGEVELDAGSDDELTRRINAEAKDLENGDNVGKEVEWTVDTSEDAVKARAKDLPDDLKRALVVEDDDGADDVYNQLGSWILDQANEKGGVSKVEDVDIYMKAKELGIEKKRGTLTVLAQAIFDENILKDIPKRAGMLKKMMNGSSPEKYEKAFLGGTERFVGVEKPDLLPKLPLILQSYYTYDVVSEEISKEFFTKASRKYTGDVKVSKKVRKAAEPYLKWLEEAEEESSEEE